jgi:LPXTG-site transpeptidase (sortase) family protein
MSTPRIWSKMARPAVLALAVMLMAASWSAACGGGGDDEPTATATPSGPTSTPVPPTPSVEQVLKFFAAILPTATPVPPDTYTSSGYTGGGGGGGSAAPRGGTGPGPIRGTDIRLSIPRAGVNATVYARAVGSNGQMGNPAGAYDVIWYDFPNHPGLGGYPGAPGANAVFAGHVDYIGVGPAVFYSLKNLAPGDVVTVSTSAGTFTYRIEWSRWAEAYEDFTSFVRGGGPEMITLVTCIGGFSGGTYSNRLVVRGVRI